jgi:hypothetical protein
MGDPRAGNPLALVLLVAIFVLIAVLGERGGPNYIVVSGPRLVRPVALSNWSENLAPLLALGVAQRRDGIRQLA